MSILNIPTRMSAEIDRSVVSRRRLLKHAGAFAGAAALLSGSQLAGMAENATTLEFDVACDGRTFVINRQGDGSAAVKRGDTFIVNGKIYPVGTIAQGLSGPSQSGSIGTWICRGWFYYGLDDIFAGAVPHIISTQTFLFDNYDGLVTDGTEGGQFVVRPIVGGYGAFRGARGESTEIEVEENDSLIDAGDDLLIPAPNIRFTFQLEQ